MNVIKAKNETPTMKCAAPALKYVSISNHHVVFPPLPLRQDDALVRRWNRGKLEQAERR